MNNITTSQTIGPFSHEAWQWAVDASPVETGTATAGSVTISGIVYDGAGTPVNDAQIEAWLPHGGEAEERRALPGFRRVPTDTQGRFTLNVPRSSPAGEPVAYITLFARGLVKHQFSAVFLDDDAGLAQSPILEQVPAARRATLIAKNSGADVYTWDIWMQTDKETVFFDWT
ncbi:MAG: putative protocatechuate 3,4-dioxygenase alpha chain protein [Massilia sp.]|jgi:protocatechuate 3,4-dioxygenase alpha subunit|nr:putative protocatechuate 3,4-dioxygenase alpha chain protein [Massilia sp.]